MKEMYLYEGDSRREESLSRSIASASSMEFTTTQSYQKCNFCAAKLIIIHHSQLFVKILLPVFCV